MNTKDYKAVDPATTLSPEALRKASEGALKVYDFLPLHPKVVLYLLDMLEAAQKSLAQYRVYDDVISEIDRRADKEWCLGDGCDFTVTVTYDQYLAIDAAMAATKGEEA